MTTITYGESLRIEMRTYFSMDYLTGAALLARKVLEIEATHTHTSLSVPETQRAEHKAFATASIMMSSTAIEAFVHELFAECRD
ncbi:hypothetical protein FPJ27_36705 (plasmid) [Burkholderia sp. MS455]|uniref:hypothetical protein n=1 Tax=Burkholderia sp. MS455 TaxID=2811788 RepID=UPI001957411B|nr:hypothetical protein [Burkholderia sp. MS455]QRR11757.1 hypothetical protein FPJ27_36705 [Burkholderia sp. MS455]